MAPAQLEKRITMISTGSLPSSKLLELSASRPFVHQAWTHHVRRIWTLYSRHGMLGLGRRCISFRPSSRSGVQQTRNGLLYLACPTRRGIRGAPCVRSRAWSGQVRLATLLSADTSLNHGVCGSDAHVASTGVFLPDAWSSREGSIILSAGKETFQALGLPGAKFSSHMSGAPEQYRMSMLYSSRYSPLLHTYGSYQLLTQRPERKCSKPRLHPRFAHAVGPISGRIWRRTVGFRVSRLKSWCVI